MFIPDPNIFSSRIPDSNSTYPGSRIRTKELKYPILTQKIVSALQIGVHRWPSVVGPGSPRRWRGTCSPQTPPRGRQHAVQRHGAPRTLSHHPPPSWSTGWCSLSIRLYGTVQISKQEMVNIFIKWNTSKKIQYTGSLPSLRELKLEKNYRVYIFFKFNISNIEVLDQNISFSEKNGFLV